MLLLLLLLLYVNEELLMCVGTCSFKGFVLLTQMRTLFSLIFTDAAASLNAVAGGFRLR